VADEDPAALDVDRAVVGEFFEFAAHDLVQHAGRVDPKNPLQFSHGVRPGLHSLRPVLDGHLDELGRRGELFDAMLSEVRFGMRGDELGLHVPEVFEDLEHEVAVAARQVEELVPGDMGLGPFVVLVVHLDPVSAGRRAPAAHAGSSAQYLQVRLQSQPIPLPQWRLPARQHPVAG
jgi:hypothetical protein